MIRADAKPATLGALACALLPQPSAAQDAAAAERGIETVLVTDRAHRAEVDLTAGAVTLVDAAELRERNASSLADLLRYVPGVWSASSSGADAMFFSSRGSNLDATHYDMNGIALLQDGLPVTTADGNNHNRVLDPLSARLATIARGANALKYGAATLGGAIDLSSPTARDTDPLAIYVNAGSHGQRLARGSLGGIFGERLDGLVTLETKRWDGYRDHSEQSRDGVYANVGWRASARTETRFFLTSVTNDEDLPGFLTRAQFDADPRQPNRATPAGNFALDVDSLRLANRTVTTLGARGRVEYGFYVERQSLFHPIVDVRVDFDGAGPNAPVQVFSLLIDTDHRETGGMVRYARQLGSHDLLFGLHYAHGDVDGGNYSHDGGVPRALTTAVERSAENVTLYAVDRWQWNDRWLLEIGAQAVDAQREVVSVNAATGAVRAPRGSFSRVTPRAGVIFSASDGVDLFASVSGLYEPPTNYELEDEASGSNAILDAMSGTVLEIGTRGRREGASGRRFYWEASLFFAKVDDEILSVDDPRAPGTSLAANVDAVTHAGLEAALGAELPIGRRGATLAPRVSVTVNDFSFDSDPVYGDNDLPAAPGYALRGEILYRHPSGLFAGPTFDVVDDRFADFMNTYRVDSYTLLGFRAGWSRERWNVFAELVNAADERHVSVLGVRDAAAPDAEVLSPGAPRSVYVGAQLRF